MRTSLLVALGALVLAPSAVAETRSLTVQEPVVRASLGRAPNTAGYVTVRNGAAAADRLLGASCACAASVEIHAHRLTNGVARMEPVPGLTVPGRGRARLAPGGRHLMFLGLKRPLKAGATVDVTLRFQRAGAVPVRFRVVAAVPTPAAAERHAH